MLSCRSVRCATSSSTSASMASRPRRRSAPRRRRCRSRPAAWLTSPGACIRVTTMTTSLCGRSLRLRRRGRASGTARRSPLQEASVRTLLPRRGAAIASSMVRGRDQEHAHRRVDAVVGASGAHGHRTLRGHGRLQLPTSGGLRCPLHGHYMSGRPSACGAASLNRSVSKSMICQAMMLGPAPVLPSPLR